MSLSNLFPNVIELRELLLKETIVTIQMVIIAGGISFVLGIIIAFGLIAFKKDGLYPNKIIFTVLNTFVNIFRAIPFVIMLMAIFPLTKLLVGTTIGLKGSIVPLVFATTPFFARQFESALLEVSDGVIEAAQSMGTSNVDILYRVYLREAFPSIVRATTITLVNLLGLTTMVGAIAGGGIGDFALMYGLRRTQYDIIYTCVVIILALVYIIQIGGNLFLNKIERGK